MFITFEGLDGSGKTTALEKLVAILEKHGIDFVLTREPGAPINQANDQIRKLIVDNESSLTPMTEMLLFSADRRLHLDKLIIPALQTGKIVLCDRYFDSTFAYQGAGRQLGIEKMIKLQEIITNNFYPNLTFYFDIDADLAIKRVETRGHKNRLDNESRDFIKRVYSGYKTVIAKNPKRFIIIDATQSAPNVLQQVAKAFSTNVTKITGF